VAESKPARPSSNGASIDQRRDMALLSLARVATILNAEHDPDKSLETICREALALFNVDSAIIWEREGDCLVVKKSAGELETILRDLRVALDDPVSYSGDCFRRQVPTLRKRTPIVENWGDRGVHRPSAAAVLCVPMLHREEVLGVLTLRETADPDHFSPSDIEVACLFANMAAVAVANARLVAETARRAGEAAAMSRLVRIVSAGRDLSETYKAFADELAGLLPCERMTITILEGKAGYRVLLSAGTGDDEFEPGKLISLQGSALEWMLEHGCGIVVSDLDRGPRFGGDNAFFADGMRSAIRAPLVDRGELLGMITLGSSTPSAYGPREAEVLEQVAGQVGGVVASVRMMKAQDELLKRLNALQQVTDAALSTLDLDHLLNILLDRCIGILDADSGTVQMLSEDGTELIIRGALWMAGETPRDYRIKVGQGRIASVMLTGESLLVDDVDREDAADFLFSRERGIRSVMALPLKVRERIIGVFRLESRRPGHFSAGQVALMEVAAERMSLAIDNAGLLEEARSRASHEALIHRIDSAIGSSLDLNQVMDTAVVEIRKATEASRCLVGLGRPEASFAEARWVARVDGLPSLLGPLPWADNPYVQATMRGRDALPVEDVEADPSQDSMRPLRSELGVRSMLSMPLLQDGAPIGVVVLHQCDRIRRWTKWDSDLLGAVAAQLGVAVRNARLYGTTDEQLRERVRELGSLLRLSGAVSGELSLDAVMDRAAEEGAFALVAERCAIIEVDRDTGLMTTRSAYNREDKADAGVGRELKIEGYPHYAQALLLKQPVRVSTQEILRVSGQGRLLQRLGITHCLLVPLIVSDRATGLIFLGRKEGMPDFFDGDVALAKAVASQVAVAMENARLFQEIKSQKAQTETLLTSMSEGVYATDLQGRITAVNPWLERMVGLRADEMLGKQCSEVLHHSDEDGTSKCASGCPLHVALQDGSSTEPRILFTQTAWGERIPTVVSAAPLRDETGRITGAVSVSRDISREWQVDKLKSNIVSVVSHEFRTPLTSIIGFSDLMLLRQDMPEGKRHDCLQAILTEGLKLEALVSDFLDASRLGSGKVALHPQLLEVRAVVAAAIDAVRGRVGHRNLSAEVREGLPPMEADPARLAQILENLLSNAVKYSEDGTAIRVRVELSSDPGVRGTSRGVKGPEEWVVITVEDQGYGIPADEMGAVFQPFHRVAGDLTRKIRGTGLGLSIVKSLVELHGGRVWAESSFGTGSSFHVAFKTARG